MREKIITAVHEVFSSLEYGVDHEILLGWEQEDILKELEALDRIIIKLDCILNANDARQAAARERDDLKRLHKALTVCADYCDDPVYNAELDKFQMNEDG